MNRIERRYNRLLNHPGKLLFFLVFFCLNPTAFAQEEKSLSEDIEPIPSDIRVLIIPVVETTFSSEIAGRVEAIFVDFGQSFERGQDLIIFDCNA